MQIQLLKTSLQIPFLLLLLFFLLLFWAGLFLAALILCTAGLAHTALRNPLDSTSKKNLRPNALTAFSLLITALLFCGCGSEAPKTPPLTEVRYAEVETQTLTLTRTLPGRISAFKVSEVRPQVGGIIKARLFEEGSEVASGQVLYQIDSALYEAAFHNAGANLEKALAEEKAAKLLSERYTRLAQVDAVSRQEMDDAVAAYNKLKAEIEAARQALQTAAINLGYTRITAPVSGRIGRSAVTEGALVTQNQEFPLAKIQQIDTVYVDITQSNAQLLKLRRALSSGALSHGGAESARVRLYLEDGSPYMGKNDRGEEEWIEGELLFSDISVDESTGTVFLRAKLDNPEGVLLPGMYVRAELVEGVLEKAVLIPQKSVGRDARNLPQIFVLTPSAEAGTTGELYTVEARSVSIDRNIGNTWLLGSGLKHGELVVMDGIHKIRPGQKVRGSRSPKEASHRFASSGRSRE